MIFIIIPKYLCIGLFSVTHVLITTTFYTRNRSLDTLGNGKQTMTVLS